MEEAERNLGIILRDKTIDISRVGLDFLVEVERNGFHEAVKELKENPELKLSSFQNVVTYERGDRAFLMVGLNSAKKGFSVLLRTEISRDEMEEGYFDIIEILKKFYKAAEFYGREARAGIDDSNIRIPSGTLDGLDCFDLDIIAESDVIKKAYVNIDISRIADSSYYKELEIYNLISYASRFDWKAGIFPEICLCSAFEKLMQLELTDRVRYIRMLLCELSRISNHIYFISNMCNILQLDIAYNLSLMERERILRILEKITGSRVNPNFIRIGGVKEDITAEILAGIRKSMPLLFKNIKAVEGMVKGDFTVIERLRDTGVISKELALEYGVSGPNLRASGARYDLRRDRDFISYKDLSFKIPIGRRGDCLDRVLMRFSEIFQSLKLIKQIIGKIPPGEHIKKINMSHLEFQPGMTSYVIECPHGLFKIFMEVGRKKVKSMVVMGPSLNSLILGGKILKGNNVEDINMILTSLDISPGEIMSAGI
ncbi:MAG: hypothetical protein U9O59_07570 [Actinomycetota bacterium]|nr:hypothetical protein [Actinomycetota bacterium]